MSAISFDIGERPIDPPEGMDMSDIYVKAHDQLEAEGVDVFDLRSEESKRHMLELVQSIYTARKLGMLDISGPLLRQGLERIDSSELDAVAEEMRDAQEYSV